MPVKFVTDGNPDGTMIGGKTTDLIGFYGNDPVPQRSNAAQGNIQGVPMSYLVAFQSTVTPSSVTTPYYTAESNISVTGMLSTDFVIAVNKPTTQAGLSLAGWRAGAANGSFNLNFGNATAAQLTPTAGELYSIIVSRGAPIIQQSLTPAAVAPSTAVEQIFNLMGSNAAGTAIINSAGQVIGVNITNAGSNYWTPPTVVFGGGSINNPLSEGIATGGADGRLDAATGLSPRGQACSGVAVVNTTGNIIGVKITNPGYGYQVAPSVSFIGGNWLTPGMAIVGSKPTAQAGLGVGNWRVAGNGQVGITFTNYTANTITPTAAETYSFAASYELASASNYMTYGAAIITPGAAITGPTTSEVAITVMGIVNNSDWVVGISKPTMQTGLWLGGARVAVTTPNAVYATFGVATTAGITPTGGEIYTITVGKGTPQQPMMLYPIYVSTFTSVAANSGAEQAVTVTGVPASSIVNMTPPQLPAGLVFGGARVSAANVVQVNWVNATGTAIVPPTGVYTFANFPATAPGAGNYTATPVNFTQHAKANFINEVQNALVTLGLVKGA